MFNVHIVGASRANKDSAIRREALSSGFGDSLPNVKLRDLSNGVYRGRFWPPDTKKNPHGYIDFREHQIPQEFIIDGTDPRLVKAQCPRSSNWEPLPSGYDEEGNPLYTHRCLCCELCDWVYGPLDPDDPNSISVWQSLEGLGGLQDIITTLDWKSAWFSKVSIPATIQMRVHSRTKETSMSGNEYEKVVYAPGGTNDYLGALLNLRQPDQSTKVDENTGAEVRIKNGLSETLFDYLGSIPDANDAVTGRWWTLTKANDGKGVGGYAFQFDPHPSSFDAKTHVDYNRIYSFMSYGDATKNKPSTRLSYDQQLAIINNAAWAEAIKTAGVPITDEEVDAYWDELDGIGLGPGSVDPAQQQYVQPPTAPTPPATGFTGFGFGG